MNTLTSTARSTHLSIAPQDLRDLAEAAARIRTPWTPAPGAYPAAEAAFLAEVATLGRLSDRRELAHAVAGAFARALESKIPVGGALDGAALQRALEAMNALEARVFAALRDGTPRRGLVGRILNTLHGGETDGDVAPESHPAGDAADGRLGGRGLGEDRPHR